MTTNADPPKSRLTPTRLVLLILLVFAAGFGTRMYFERAAESDADEEVAAEAEKERTWTCSMHPQIRSNRPGTCPICAMDLIPVAEDDDDDPDAGPRRFSTSETAAALMNVQTRPVERRLAQRELRLVGRVDLDETRFKTITAWAPGRIERSYVDFTGAVVRAGDPLVQLYSPELLAGFEELRAAARAEARLHDDSPAALRRTVTATREALRAKLRRLGLTERQIADAESGDAPVSDRITIHAPIGGTVIERAGKEGMYVGVGETLYTISALDKVWVQLEAYESDLPWLRLGQTVAFTAEARPGETFEGAVVFIDPVLNPRTRTARVRLEAPNPDGRLKPDLFVRAVVTATLDAGGAAVAPEHAGHTAPPLVIPASAPLITGRRALVYVKVPGAERPTFEGREVALGPRAGDFYIVESGLDEGEQVVVHGAFKIDSAMQLLARHSMMRMDDAPPPEAAPEGFRDALGAVLDAYLVVKNALADDDFDAAAAAAPGVLEALRNIDPDALDAEGRDDWPDIGIALRAGLDAMIGAEDIDGLRVPFEDVSDALIAALRRFGLPDGRVAYVLNCPMAFDFEGADWLQDHDQVLNPYFGDEMLRCGAVEDRIEGATVQAPETGAAPPPAHAH